MGEVEPGSFAFDVLRDDHAVDVMLEWLVAEFRQRSLSGVPVGGVSDVVPCGYRHAEVLVESELARDSYRYPYHVLSVDQACPDVGVVRHRDELRL